MKIWDITYTNSGREGTAIVSAQTANQAGIVLQSSGSLNGTRYNITSIKDIGCNNLPYTQLISESYTGQKTDTPEVPDTPGNGKFDVDSLTDEDIAKLRTRLDIHERAIYVNRIGNAPHPYPNVTRKRQDGYLLFVSPYGCTNGGIMGGEKDSKGRTIGSPNLYILRGGKYKPVQIPDNIQFIISPTRIISIKKSTTQGGRTVYYDWATVSDFRKKRYCLFCLKNTRFNRPYWKDNPANTGRCWMYRKSFWAPVLSLNFKPVLYTRDLNNLTSYKSFIDNLLSRLDRDIIIPSRGYPFTSQSNGKVVGNVFCIAEYKMSKGKTKYMAYGIGEEIRIPRAKNVIYTFKCNTSYG